MACSLSYSGLGGSTFEEGEDPDMQEKEDKLLIKKEVTIKDLMEGKYNIIYTHPECLFESKAMAKMLRSKCYQGNLCGIIIDEVRILLVWGQEFRPNFRRLGELTCLYPEAAHLALTATAKPESIAALQNHLNYQNVNVITFNVDRPNIFIDISPRPPNIRKIEKYNAFIEPLAKQPSVELDKFPVTIAYIENLESFRILF